MKQKWQQVRGFSALHLLASCVTHLRAGRSTACRAACSCSLRLSRCPVSLSSASAWLACTQEPHRHVLMLQEMLAAEGAAVTARSVYEMLAAECATQCGCSASAWLACTTSPPVTA